MDTLFYISVLLFIFYSIKIGKYIVNMYQKSTEEICRDAYFEIAIKHIKKASTKLELFSTKKWYTTNSTALKCFTGEDYEKLDQMFTEKLKKLIPVKDEIDVLFNNIMIALHNCKSRERFNSIKRTYISIGYRLKEMDAMFDKKELEITFKEKLYGE